jgi:hypothetical protein
MATLNIMTLAFDLKTCASMLNIGESELKDSVERGEIQASRLGKEWRVSIFELARILRTSTDELIEYLEDMVLAEMIQKVEGEESFTPGEGRSVYEAYIHGEKN